MPIRSLSSHWKLTVGVGKLATSANRGSSWATAGVANAATARRDAMSLHLLSMRIILPKVFEPQFDVSRPLIFVLFDRVGDLDAVFFRRQVRLALGGVPLDRSQDAAVLLHAHLEMAFLQQSGAVDDRDAVGVELRTRIAGTERRQRRKLHHDALVDVVKRKRAIEP